MMSELAARAPREGKGAMGFVDYRRDLLDENVDPNYVLDKYYHSGGSLVFQGAPPGEEAELKTSVATQLHKCFRIRVHPYQLILCGSAHLGFCPVPDERFGRSFDPATSDIDIAVVSPELFEMCWTELQTSGLDPDSRALISRDLFWGFFNPANIQDKCDFGRTWWDLFGHLRTDRAHGIRGRLYKNYWSMQSYHKLSIVRARQQLLEERDNGARSMCRIPVT